MLLWRNALLLFGFVWIDLNLVSKADEISPATTESLIDQAIAEFREIEKNLKNDKEQLGMDRKNLAEEKILYRLINKTDLFPLNVGGEILTTTRQTLTSIPQSLFSILFNGRWEQKLQRDPDGNIVLDFNPIIFRHLLDQLQLSDLKTIALPSDPSLARAFEKMMKKLNLQHLLPSLVEKNILTVNVAGQIMTTQNSHLKEITNSNWNSIIPVYNHSERLHESDVFIDYHPKLFRTWKKYRRENRQNFRRHQLKANIKWKQNATTIARGNGLEDDEYVLNWPSGIYVDDIEKTIYIANLTNARIMKWKLDRNNDEAVASGNGSEVRIDQLSIPFNVIVDQETKSLIICDHGNRRVVRWSRENQLVRQIIASDIDCSGLMMNTNGDLFASDLERHEVKRWRKGEREGTVVAGGNGEGDALTQLDYPTSIYIDHNDTVYVSDTNNHRVIKWMKGAKEGIVVTVGQRYSSSLFFPQGVIVNEVGDVYVVDSGHHRIMCWSVGSKEGRVVIGGNGPRQGSDGLSYPLGLSFDGDNNLYVVDEGSNRIQRYDVDEN